MDQLGVHRRFGRAWFWTIGHVQLEVSPPSIPSAPVRCKSLSCTWPIVQTPHRRRTLLRMRRAWQRTRGVRVECTCRIGSTSPIEMLPTARSSSTACPAPHHTRSAPAPAAACCVAGHTPHAQRRETDGYRRGGNLGRLGLLSLLRYLLIPCTVIKCCGPSYLSSAKIAHGET